MSDKADKSPFSVYDFMGYIIPGMLFLTCMFLVYLTIRGQSKMYGKYICLCSVNPYINIMF